MTTAELRKRLEKIEANGCPKKEAQDYRLTELAKDLNGVGKVVAEDRKATAEALVRIHDRIDNMKNITIVQLCGVVLALVILVFNIIKGG